MIDPLTRDVEQTLRIRAHPETVWRYWTDPQRMCDWWGESAELDARPGGICLVDLGGGAVMRGEYVELVPHERIVLTFGWQAHEHAPAVAPGSSRVEITLSDDDGDTIMTLRHTGLPDAETGKHDDGWAHFLPLLADAARSDQETRPRTSPSPPTPTVNGWAATPPSPHGPPARPPEWIDLALTRAASLPPKAPTKRAKRKVS